MTSPDQAPTAPAVVRERGLSTAVDLVTRVVAPVSLLTAILYYFGYVREHALFGYFGVDPESLKFSTADYLVRSAGTIFLPVGTVLACGIFALLAHHLLTFVLSNASSKWRHTAWAGTGVTAAVLLVLGVVGLERPIQENLPAVLSPISLGAGALLAEYSVYIAVAYTSLPRSLADTLESTQSARRILVGALLLVSAFWATSVVAQQRGEAVAETIEASLPVQPEAVVYSRQRLQITGPGITVTRLPGADAAFDYRYSGLRPLIQSGGHWFLLPEGWNRTDGATVIILPDTTPRIRVDLGPGGL